MCSYSFFFFNIPHSSVEQPHMIIDANNFVVKSKLNFNSLRKLSCTFQCFGGGQKQGDLVTWWLSLRKKQKHLVGMFVPNLGERIIDISRVDFQRTGTHIGATTKRMKW